MTQNEQMMVEPVSRRDFLKGLTAAGVMAVAAGAGAAWLTEQNRAPAAINSLAPTATLPNLPPINAAGGNPAASDLMARLAAAQAENVRLQAELDAANRRLEGLEQVRSDNTAVVTLQNQLKEANSRVSVLAGLVALYQQLEQLDLGGALSFGFGAVGALLGRLSSRLPNVGTGLSVSRQALDQFEQQASVMDNGRQWLGHQLSKLNRYYEAVEQVLRAVADTAGSLMQMMNDWLQKLLGWLPFGLGRQSAEVMENLTTLVTEVPHTINGLRVNVLQPLNSWLALNERNEMPLQANLIKPLRQQALDPTEAILTDTEAALTSYQTELLEPAQTLLAHRQAVRDRIQAYREQHQV
jgi:DNA repair exonuclease SbcCD ATPase subunit